MKVGVSVLTINRVKLGNDDYPINVSISKNGINAFYSRDNDELTSFFLKLSGINFADDIYYNEKLVYENQQFFQKRVYYDCSSYFIKSIFHKQITAELKRKYNFKIDGERLKRFIDDLMLRAECSVGGDCKFPPNANTLINYAVVSSSDKEIMLINNPTIHLYDERQRNYLIEDLISLSKEKQILLGINDLSHFSGHLNNLWLFTDFNTFVQVNPALDEVSLIYGAHKEELKSCLKEDDLLFETSFNGQYGIMFINKNTAREERTLRKQGFSLVKIPFFDIERYL